jgi:hypothetical protein
MESKSATATSPLDIDVTGAQRFLDLLAPGEEITFQTFPDSEDLKNKRGLTRVLHGSLKAHAAELSVLNEEGAGIFFMVNAGDGTVHDGERTCRTARNVTRVRANFVDLDGSPIEPILASPAPPSIVVASSPGRWHAYWLVEGETVEDFTYTQVQLIERFKADPSVKDLPRVMRLPGFFHRKYQPYRVAVTHLHAKEQSQ